ncbi:MAG: nuclear transport factor 2 family protein [Bacteroidota bacterium]
MKLVLLTVLSLISFAGYTQQAEEIAIKQVVLNLFTAMQQGDTTAARNCFDSTAHLHTALIKPTTGKTKLEMETLDAFIKIVGSFRSRNLQIEERIVKWDIKTDFPMASVWADYEFYVSGKLSHKGVDAFQLFKASDGWKIIQICDTRRK